jgi:hypothetical protein
MRCPSPCDLLENRTQTSRVQETQPHSSCFILLLSQLNNVIRLTTRTEDNKRLLTSSLNCPLQSTNNMQNPLLRGEQKKVFRGARRPMLWFRLQPF